MPVDLTSQNGMTTDTVFTLTCRKCNVAYPLPPTRCAACGPTLPVWEGRPSEGTRWVACSKCHRCLQRHEAATLPEPQDCPDCGTPDQGWCDAQGNWWDPAHQQTPQLLDTWISGQFDGNYDGALLAGHADGLSLRSYTFAVREAVLSGVQSLATPPLPIDSSALAPLRLPIVRNVHVIYYAADMQPRSVLADLHDFRLHAWGNASTEQVANGRPTLAGRFWGTAYARLSAPAEHSPQAATSFLTPSVGSEGSAAPDITPAASANPTPADTKPAGLDPERDRDNDPHASNSAHEARDRLPPQDHTPAGDTPDVSARATPASDDGQMPAATTSLPQDPVAGGTKQSNDASSAATPRQQENKPGQGDIPDPTSSMGAAPEPALPPSSLPREPAAAGEKPDDGPSPSHREPAESPQERAARSQTRDPHHAGEQAFVSPYVKARQRLWGSAPFLRPRWPLFLFMLGSLLWLLCGWPVMLLGLGALLLQRALHLALFKHRNWPSPRWRLLAHPLLLLVLALWALFAIIAHSNSPECLQPSWFWIGLLGLLLLLSALARARLAATIIALLWIVALFTAFRERNNTCGQSLSQAVSASVVTTGAQFKRQAKEMASYDQDAEIVSTGATKSQGEQRVSLTQALEDPSRYFSCAHASNDTSARPAEIYLGESALFGFNSARLNAEAEANLSKLGTLIAHNPDASIVLTGHTDKLGVPLLNIKLSEQRAKRIADWLIAHDVT